MLVLGAENASLGMEPKSWIALGTFVLSVVGAGVSWYKAWKAKASSEEAKGVAEYANRARKEIADKLDAANKIAADAHALQAEFVALEKSKRERYWDFEAHFKQNGGGAQTMFVLVIRNRSPEKSLSLRSVRLSRDGTPENAVPFDYAVQTGNHFDIQTGTISEVGINAFMAATFGSKTKDDVEPLTDRARLFVEFAHEPSLHIVERPEWIKFLGLAGALADWFKKNPQSFNGEGRGWDTRGFTKDI